MYMVVAVLIVSLLGLCPAMGGRDTGAPSCRERRRCRGRRHRLGLDTPAVPGRRHRLAGSARHSDSSSPRIQSNSCKSA